MIAFGPIPSRRLGQSLGVNHIPSKACSYDCAYCQVGRTSFPSRRRQAFYRPEVVAGQVEKRVAELKAVGARLDYLSLVPDGEPTLDIHLGELIGRLQPLGIPIAVFTNSSLLDDPQVRLELSGADLVSLKVDSVEETRWRRLNRPVEGLRLEAILEGCMAFSEAFNGRLITETLLVRGVNDRQEGLAKTASFIAGLRPDTAYLAIPTRPPSESWAGTPGADALARAYAVFAPLIPQVECLSGFSPEAYLVGGNARENLLAITAVHPMREEELLQFLEQAQSPRQLVDDLLAQGLLIRVLHEGQAFYLHAVAATSQRKSSRKGLGL